MSIKAMVIVDLIRVHRVLPFPIRARLWTVFGFMMILALLEVASMLSLTFLSLSVVAPEQLMGYRLVSSVLDRIPTLKALCADPRYLALVTSFAVVALVGIKNLMSAFVGVETSKFGERIALFAGERIFHQYLYAPYLQHLSGDGMAMFQAIGWRSHLGTLCINLLNVYTYAIITVAMIITLVTATPTVIFFTITAIAIFSALLYRAMKRSVDRAGRMSSECTARETQATMSAMNGIREVLIYQQQPQFFRAFASACEDGAPSRAFLSIAPPIPTWVLEVVGFGVIPAALWIMVARQNATMIEMTGVLTMIMLAAWRILPMLNRSLACLVTARGLRHAALQCLERIEQTFAKPVVVPPDPEPGFSIQESVCLEGVRFRYPGARMDVLHGIDLSIARGQQIGIIGASGSGKSTIAALISGLIPPTSGAFTVDGRQLSPGQMSAYIRKVGYVPQSPYILPGTVAENVAFSQWGKPYDVDKVRDACRLAALDLVESHPLGINIPIGERGTGISGGQAQRVCIARVLFASPELLILDEATSSLDQGAEAAIVDTVSRFRGRLTTVVIAHRLSTVRHCDRIVWIDDGRIVDQGDPESILPKYEKSLKQIA